MSWLNNVMSMVTPFWHHIDVMQCVVPWSVRRAFVCVSLAAIQIGTSRGPANSCTNTSLDRDSCISCHRK